MRLRPSASASLFALPFLVACGSFEGALEATGDGGAPVTDGGGVADGGNGTDGGGPVDGGAPIDAGRPADAGTPVDAGPPADAGQPLAGLCDSYLPLASGEYGSKQESSGGQFTGTIASYAAKLQDGGGEATLPMRNGKGKVCFAADVDLSAAPNSLSNDDYTLLGGQLLGVTGGTLGRFGVALRSGRLLVGFANGGGASVDLNNRRSFRMEISVDASGLGQSNLHYRVRGGGALLGEGDVPGSLGSTAQVTVGALCSGGGCKQLTVTGTNGFLGSK